VPCNAGEPHTGAAPQVTTRMAAAVLGTAAMEATPNGCLGHYHEGHQEEAASGPQQIHGYGVAANVVRECRYSPGRQASDRGGSERRDEQCPAKVPLHDAAHRNDVLNGASR